MFYKALFLISIFTFASCEKDSDMLTGNAELGGELVFKKESLSYVVGNGKDTEYSSSISIYQGNEKVQSIDIYKTFSTKDADGNELKSNRVFLKTLTVPTSNQHVDLDYSVTFNELYKDLSIGGNPLSNNDGDLQIGDYWTLSFVSHTTNSLVHEVGHKVKLSVGTRFAGIYKCVDANYYRIGVLTASTADWPTQTVIESVDATTYKVNDYFGYFSGNTYYFKIDSNDVITYPATTPDGTAQTGNGQPMITCQTNPNDMTLVNCGSSNVVVRDNVNGKDQLKMSFGYYTAGSGPRVFYQVLEKIVE